MLSQRKIYLSWQADTFWPSDFVLSDTFTENTLFWTKSKLNSLGADKIYCSPVTSQREWIYQVLSHQTAWKSLLLNNYMRVSKRCLPTQAPLKPGLHGYGSRYNTFSISSSLVTQWPPPISRETDTGRQTKRRCAVQRALKKELRKEPIKAMRNRISFPPTKIESLTVFFLSSSFFFSWHVFFSKQPWN